MEGMFSPELEKLIKITLADGVLTDQEKSVLIKKAQAEGVDVDQLDVYIQYLMQQRKEEEMKQAEARKAKETMGGEVKKCPNCGAVYVPGSLVCACGHMFDISIQSNAYVKFADEVQKKIAALSSDKGGGVSGMLTDVMNKFSSSNPKIDAIQQFIANYPVPTNRIDLLEFLLNLQGNANPNGPKGGRKKHTYEDNLDFGYYYWELFTKCINKAKVYFSTDNDFQSSFQYYNEKTTKKSGFFAKLFG